jgi:hypothetical protein
MPNGLPYRVSWSRKAREALYAAAAAGVADEMAGLARAVDERLSLAPLAFGEAYRTKGAVEERLAVLAFLAIDFAVDVQRRFVLVRTCRLLSRRGSNGNANA